MVIRSKLIADIEVEFAISTVHILLNGNAVINAQGTDWKIEPKAQARI
jgi:hypothetical protein